MGHRSIALLVSAVFALASSSVFALGLGKINLNSTLNQPLQAEIELYEVRDLTKEEIKVSVASREDFERIGVDKTYFLSDLQFEVVLTGRGSPLVKITSTKVVREPFLNFVLQVQWPSGKLLREYTLLLDLPTYSDKPAPAVQSSTGSAPPPSSSRPATGPSTSASPSSNPRSVYEAAPARPSAASAPVAPSYTDDSYRVRANDTLWEIAASVRPSSEISIHQTMIALQRANPEAFINNNINLLKQGQILRIPEPTEMAELNQREAVREVAVQNSAWSGAPREVADAQLSASNVYSDTSSSPTTREGRVKLSSPDETYGSNEGRATGGSADVSTEALENELAATLEQLDKGSRENSELKSKIASLEEQIQTMERMLEVSNESMRALELAAQQTPQQSTATDASSSAEASVDNELTSDAASAEGDAGDLNLATDVQSTDEQNATGELDLASELEAVAADAETASDGAQTTPAPTTAPVATPISDPKKVVISQPVPEKSLIDLLFDNIIYLALGVVAIAAGVFFLLRRKSADEENFDDYMEQHGLHGEPVDDTVIQGRRSAAVDEEDDLDLGDFSGDLEEEPRDDQMAQFEEEDEPLGTEPETEDVVAEADIYIAYGKFDQAEEMLLKALSKDSADEDVRLKLLEVYSAQGDAENFDPHFAKLRASGSPAALERAESLRSNIPNVPPFDASSFDSSVALSDSGSTKDYSGYDLDLPESDDFASGGLDLDLGDLDSDGDPDNGLDLELNDDASEDNDGLALDFDMGDAGDDDFALDLDLGDDDLDLEGAKDDEAPSSFANVSLTSSDDDGAFDFDLDGSSEDELSSEELGLDFESDKKQRSRDDEESADDDLDLGDFRFDAEESPMSGSLEDDLASLDAELDLSLDYKGASSDADLGDLEADFADLDLDDTPSKPALSGDTVVNEALNDEYIEQKLGDDSDDLDLDAVLPLEDEDVPGQTQTLDSVDLDDDTDLDLSSLDQELDALTSGMDRDEVTAQHRTPAMEEPITDFDDFEDELEKDEANAETVKSDHTLAADVEGMGEDTMFDEAIRELPAAEDSDLDFELPEVDPDDVDDDDLDFLSDSDETATKLDLARAYIDMGDQEGAREIIREVMGEGNSQQKSEAENLLARIEA